ncbi:MAG: GNAT family N-acetyltransferase [Spirochaetales bacterium]|nr:GNAT family N-acetyltransferase [Spirochaetales bacterium]
MSDKSESMRQQSALLIRRAEEKDIPTITKIYNEAVINTAATFHVEPVSTDERHQWLLKHDAARPVIVAQSGDTPVGWASLSRWNPKPAYDGSVELSVYVDRSVRGEGIGKALMEDLIRRAEQAKLHTIISLITEGNEVSMKLHRQLGFEQTGVIREAGYKFEQFLDVTVWQKML